MSDNWEPLCVEPFVDTPPAHRTMTVRPVVAEPPSAPWGSTMTIRTMRNILLLCLAAGFLSGCERVDWNWDASWWRTPRPSPGVRPAASREEAKRSREGRSTARTSEPRRADDGSRTANADSRNAGPDADDPQAAPAVAKDRPYYQLYLLSNAAASETISGTGRLRLQHVAARQCAGVLEMLYVPLGRSGSDEECYLIYEQREEFEAARVLAPLLDIQPSKEAANTNGAEAALNNGLALMLSIMQERPADQAAADRADVGRCERFFAEATQSGEIPARKRWVAAILAGRLRSTYLYDHAGARGYFDRAKRQTEEGSIEEMTAEWWRADTFVQEGNRDRANAIYKRLLSDYRDTWPDSSIVARSKAILKKHRKR